MPTSENVECPHCGKSYPKKGLGSHIWRTHGAGKGFVPNPSGPQKEPWNKGLTKEDPRVRRNAESISLAHRQRVADGIYTPPPRTPAQLAQLSKRMSQKNRGGRCKWYEVDGRRVQGTWERDLAMKMDELGIEWKRLAARGNRTWRYADGSGKVRRYSPDFYLPALELQLEVKGYWWGNDRQKMDWVQAQNPEARIRIVEGELFRELLGSPDASAFLTLIGE